MWISISLILLLKFSVVWTHHILSIHSGGWTGNILLPLKILSSNTASKFEKRCNISEKQHISEDEVYWNCFIFTEKLSGRYRDFLNNLWAYTCMTTSVVDITHGSGTFVTVDEPTLTHRNHRNSLVYLRVHSCCTFCGFGQIYNDIYSLVGYSPWGCQESKPTEHARRCRHPSM